MMLPKKSEVKKMVVEANAILMKTENCYYFKLDSDKGWWYQGWTNYLVNETGNLLLICKLDDEKKFREFVSMARKKGEEFI